MNYVLKILVSVTVAALSFKAATAQVRFNKQYDRNGAEGAFAVIKTKTGDYCTVGTQDNVAYLGVLFNNTGDTLWSLANNNIPSPNFGEFAQDVLELDDSYLMIGIASDTVLKQSDCRITKITKQGKYIYSKAYDAGHKFSDRAYAAKQISDTTIAVAGYYYDSLATKSIALLMIVDTSCQLRKAYEYGGSAFTFIKSFDKATNNEGFILGGNSDNFGGRKLYFLKVGADYAKEWDTAYGGKFENYGYSVIALRDQNYLLGGETYKDLGGFDTDGILIKVNKMNGVRIWERTYGSTVGVDRIRSIKELPNGNILACGVSHRVGKSGKKELFGWGLKLDSLGNKIWERFYRSPDTSVNYGNFLFSNALTPDGGMVMAGYIAYLNARGHDLWIVKVDSLGCDSLGCITVDISEEELHHTGQLKIYPNPSAGPVTVATLLPASAKKSEVVIFDLQGKELERRTISSKPEVFSLPQGLYFAVLFIDGRLHDRKKMAVE